MIPTWEVVMRFKYSNAEERHLAGSKQLTIAVININSSSRNFPYEPWASLSSG
jgi:hypothetical protein